VLRPVFAAAATAWSVVYVVVYLWVIDAQEGAIAWCYVVLIVLAALSFALAALGIWARAALTVGLVTSALAMLVGLLSLGALLAPTVVAALIPLVVTRPGAIAPAAADEPQPSQQRGSPADHSTFGRPRSRRRPGSVDIRADDVPDGNQRCRSRGGIVLLAGQSRRFR
jgi:hypothetical protein